MLESAVFTTTSGGVEGEMQEFDTITDSLPGTSCSLWMLFLMLSRA